jgi:hypothetical protein
VAVKKKLKYIYNLLQQHVLTVGGWGFFKATIHVVKMMLHMLFFYITGMCANDIIMVFCKKT